MGLLEGESPVACRFPTMKLSTSTRTLQSRKAEIEFSVARAPRGARTHRCPERIPAPFPLPKKWRLIPQGAPSLQAPPEGGEAQPRVSSEMPNR